MLHITDQQISELLDYRSVAAALEQAFHDMAHGEAAVHGRQRTDCAGMKLSTMGAIWPGQGVAGVKVYPTVGGQFSFAIVLFDLKSNTPIAVLDGNELTRFRTAAMTALVASKAAKPASRKLALFGAGLQGRSQAQALCEIFSFDEVCVVDPLADPHWCEWLQGVADVPVRVTSAQDAVRDADIVVTATRSSQPVFNGDWLSPGVFIAAIGTSTPKGRELDDLTMLRAARIIVEWKPQSLVEAGEIVLWDGQRDIETFVDLPQLFRADEPWQADKQAITVFKSVGVGLSDVATAHLALSRARAGLAQPAVEAGS